MKNFTKKMVVVAVIMGMLPLVKSQNLTQKYGSDSIECVTQLSLYREVYKQKNYEEAYPYWKWVKENCPMSSKYIFADGPKILDYKIKHAKV